MGFISCCLIMVINIWRLFSSLLRKELDIVNTKGNEIQNSCLKQKQLLSIFPLLISPVSRVSLKKKTVFISVISDNVYFLE